MGPVQFRSRRLTLAPGWSAMLSGLDLKVSESARDIIKGKGPWGKFWMLSTDESEDDSCGEDDTSSDDGVSTRALSVWSSQASNSVAPGESSVEAPLPEKVASLERSSVTPVGKCVRPWNGPLPKPRRSPKLTLGDALLMAKAGKFHGGRKRTTATRSGPSETMRRHPPLSSPRMENTRRGRRTERSNASSSSSKQAAAAACIGGPGLRESNASVGQSGDVLWRCAVQNEPYKPPVGLVVLFDRTHASLPLYHRAPKTKRLALGSQSYADSTKVPPTLPMENRGDSQQGVQGGRPVEPGAGRAAPRQGFQYNGSGQFRPGYGGGRGYAQNRGRTWSRAGHGRGMHGPVGGRGAARPNPAGPGTMTPASGMDGTTGTGPVAGGSIGTAGDQAGMAAVLLQQALSALQGMNADKGGGAAQPSAAQQPVMPVPSDGKKVHPKPAVVEEKKKSDQEKEGFVDAPKNNKSYCHRCYGKGHVMSECSTALFCEVCGTDTHIKHKCPVFNAPKVYAVPAGFGINKGGFFHIPSNKKLVKTKQDARTAMIQVSEGQISLENVNRELDRLLPGSAPWKVEQVSASSYRITFPSASELQRMVEWGPVRAKSQKAVLEFIASTSMAEGRVKARLTDVWVQFDGLPAQLCTYQHIWGVGSTLGVTVEVDMPFFRKHGICRMLVAVIDPEAIPFAGDVEINKIIYEVHYWVEQGPLDDEPTPMVSDLGGDDQGNGDNSKQNNAKEGNEQFKMPGEEGRDGEEKKGSNDVGEHKQVMDAAPVDDGQALQCDEENRPAVFEEKAAMATSSESQGTKAATVQQLAAISECVQTLAAGRKRRPSTSDEHALARAERLKAERNGGTQSMLADINLYSIFNIPVSEAVLNLSNIGIGLGKNDREVSDSVVLLDKEQNSRPAAKKVEGVTDVSDSESLDSSREDDIDKFILHNLCGEITDEVMDVDLVNNPYWQESGCPSSSVKTAYGRGMKMGKSRKVRKNKRRS